MFFYNAIIVILFIVLGTPRLVYMASDDTPLTRAEICEAALASNLYPDCKMPQVLHVENQFQYSE